MPLQRSCERWEIRLNNGIGESERATERIERCSWRAWILLCKRAGIIASLAELRFMHRNTSACAQLWPRLPGLIGDMAFHVFGSSLRSGARKPDSEQISAKRTCFFL